MYLKGMGRQTSTFAVAAMAVVALPSSCSYAEASGIRLDERRRCRTPRGAFTVVSVYRQPSDDNGVSAQDFFESFLKRRQAESDLVSRASDLLWRKEVEQVDDVKRREVQEKLSRIQKIREEEEADYNPGFLKLSQARSWSLGVEDAPTNSARLEEERERARDDKRRQSMLEYEALKRELSVMTVAVASVCDLYCLLILSSEAALSYALGASGSWFYLQLLYKHADNVSEDGVADVFKKRRAKRIGIRSSDLEDSFRKWIEGLRIVSQGSPRLSILAALFALAAASDRLPPDYPHLQLTPLTLGFLAYKAAALLQAYRDNKDLVVIFEKSNPSP